MCLLWRLPTDKTGSMRRSKPPKGSRSYQHKSKSVHWSSATRAPRQETQREDGKPKGRRRDSVPGPAEKQPHLQDPMARRKGEEKCDSARGTPFMGPFYWPGPSSPPIRTSSHQQTGPQKRHIISECSCKRCDQARTWRELNESLPSYDLDSQSDGSNQFPFRQASSLDVEIKRDDPDESFERPSQSEQGTRNRPSPAAAGPRHSFKAGTASLGTNPTTIHQEFMGLPKFYVFPRSTPHINFPVVDYSTNRRGPFSTLWPLFYVAVLPESASFADMTTTLAPEDSGVELRGRSSTGESVDITEFSNFAELQRAVYQLEVRDVAQTGHTRGKTRERGSGAKPRDTNHYPMSFGFPPGWGTWMTQSGKKGGKVKRG